MVEEEVEDELGLIRADVKEGWEREQHEMEALAAQTNAIQQRARMQVVQHHLQVEQLDALLQRWQGRCSICLASDRRIFCVYTPYEGQISTTGNYAMPFTNLKIPLSKVLYFNIYYLLPVEDLLALFP
ncbi:hypothetical protein LTR15_012973 [Elasticomyces elasticus]|nr:hypothetical protein LTR15_012973 [Elasticomyces elasticus]